MNLEWVFTVRLRGDPWLKVFRVWVLPLFHSPEDHHFVLDDVLQIKQNRKVQIQGHYQNTKRSCPNNVYFLPKNSFFFWILSSKFRQVDKFRTTHGDLRAAALELLGYSAVTLAGLGRLDDANLLAQREHPAVRLWGEGRGSRGPIGRSPRRRVPSPRGRNVATTGETTTAPPRGFTPGGSPRRCMNVESVVKIERRKDRQREDKNLERKMRNERDIEERRKTKEESYNCAF